MVVAGPRRGAAIEAGPGGMLDDELAFVAPWGIDPREIQPPLLIVHGGQDRNRAQVARRVAGPPLSCGGLVAATTGRSRSATPQWRPWTGSVTYGRFSNRQAPQQPYSLPLQQSSRDHVDGLLSAAGDDDGIHASLDPP
jgi:hypothetical protein